MPLDHYISQVHLKNFYSPDLGGKQMHGYHKRKGIFFPCKSKDVCRVIDGNSNAYLIRNREIEDFIATIEPKYNQAVIDLKAGRVSQTAITTIAGFCAYVTSCSPTAMRLGANPLRGALEASIKILNKQGRLPEAPAVFGKKNIGDMIDDGLIGIIVDPKYPQAIGITQIKERLGIWGNSTWELIHNEDPDSPFFTSDFASAIEVSANPRILNRLFPLTPDFAVRINPDLDAKRRRRDFSFPGFRFKRSSTGGIEVRNINRAIVQCAEELVFFQKQRSWVPSFLDRYKAFWIEPQTARQSFADGILTNSSMRIARKPPISEQSEFSDSPRLGPK